MSDRDALIAAILANPDEDTPRLMYADWLDEHGEAPRAEFIRVQCELARQRAAEADLPESFGTSTSNGDSVWPMSSRPHDTEERRDQRRRELDLLNAHSDEWRKGLPNYADNRQTRHSLRFRRGFVGHVLVYLGPLIKSPTALWEHHPVESLFVVCANGLARHKVPGCAPLAAVRELRLANRGASVITPFADCPHLSGVRELHLGFYGPHDDDLTVLARSPHLKPVALDLSCEEQSEAAFARMLAAPFASRLRRFRPYHVPAWGPEVIAGAPLPELRFLDLRGGSYGDASVVALTRSKHLTRLVTLDLSSNKLTDAALETLAAWPGLESIKSLNLSHNSDVTARGIAALLRAPNFQPIHLGLRGTGAGDDGAKELARWPGLANIIDLDLSYARVGDAGASAMADSPHWRDIWYLRLRGSEPFGEDSAQRLRSRIGGRKIDIWVR
jgi:uncharacterized protein (TIGR02996 family)